MRNSMAFSLARSVPFCLLACLLDLQLAFLRRRLPGPPDLYG